jgi:hypothetical protein
MNEIGVRSTSGIIVKGENEELGRKETYPSASVSTQYHAVF